MNVASVFQSIHSFAGDPVAGDSFAGGKARTKSFGPSGRRRFPPASPCIVPCPGPFLTRKYPMARSAYGDMFWRTAEAQSRSSHSKWPITWSFGTQPFIPHPYSRAPRTFTHPSPSNPANAIITGRSPPMPSARPTGHPRSSQRREARTVGGRIQVPKPEGGESPLGSGPSVPMRADGSIT